MNVICLLFYRKILTYRLCLALDVCEPWEQTVVYTLSLVFVALFCFATLLFVPSQITSVYTFFQLSSD
ncbi:hypothetical protein PHET_06982 [Paragonimus heterotremus]|uniref:Uncharacterized protein n=1 Tax=Paragonimus heterotremus TaxID=100268 RepID=A0A8J4SJT6_9TREM|nr:hypothetical protein PHET_06982 [Paragonimus heterotremus]